MICERTIKEYCKDDISLIENYAEAIADETQTWHLHHRKETIFTREELIEIDEYYDRPAIELIFMTKSDHMSLHASLRFKDKPLSAEHKQKMSIAHKDKHHSAETKQKMSDSLKGHPVSEEAKRKMSIAKSSENHPMFGKHHTAETKRKMSDSQPKKAVRQYSKTGEFIAEYASLTEAERKTGIAYNSISKCCKGKLKSAGGYVWKYAV